MTKLYCAGGLGEYGRNCFHVEGGKVSFLMDCGVMAGDPAPMPRLTGEQIRSLDCVFLTHSHADHSGALDWLRENGFAGPVILSQPTLAQLRERPRVHILLEKITPALTSTEVLPGLHMTWGRSGHCAGAVWYEVELAGRHFLFTGDYTEDSLVYACDPIRNIQADAAVVDCAYGRHVYRAEDCREALLKRVRTVMTQGRNIVLPVHTYGRGIEFFSLFSKLPEGVLSADEFLLKQVSAPDDMEDWVTKRGWKDIIGRRPCSLEEAARQCRPWVFLLSDPQLKREASRTVCRDTFSRGGLVLFTGHCDEGAFSAALLAEGRAEQLWYPVHQGIRQMEALCTRNFFKRVIPVHSEQITAPSAQILF